MPDCTSLYSTIVAFVNATSAGKDVYLSLTISIHYIDGTVAYLYNGANPFTAASTSLTMSSTVVSLSGAVAGTQVKGSGPWNVATLPDGTVNVQEDLGRIVLPQLHCSFKADCNLAPGMWVGVFNAPSILPPQQPPLPPDAAVAVISLPKVCGTPIQ
jgi:hypothetical protein